LPINFGLLCNVSPKFIQSVWVGFRLLKPAFRKHRAGFLATAQQPCREIIGYWNVAGLPCFCLITGQFEEARLQRRIQLRPIQPADFANSDTSERANSGDSNQFWRFMPQTQKLLL